MYRHIRPSKCLPLQSLVRQKINMSSLSCSSFLTEKVFIDGNWVPSISEKTFKVYNPANGTVIGHAAECDENDLKKAIAAAKSAFKTWSLTKAKQRSQLLRNMFNIQMKNQRALAELITLEMGKPIKESMGEVVYGASFLEWFSEEARRIKGEIFENPFPDKMSWYVREPIGVVGIITPWNFPIAMAERKLAAALSCGCTVVIRQSEDTPFTSLALAKLAEEAGIPAGVVNVITSSRINSATIGKELCHSKDVAAISFTGSTAVGKILLKESADTVKRVCLELGGNAPFIVFDSADVQKAVEGCIASKFRNTGQTCVSANRIYVQSGIHDKFTKALCEEMLKMKIGDGMNEDTTVGPLVNKKAVDKVQQHVNDVVAKGGKILIGGKHIDGNFYEPTVAIGVSDEMSVSTEETFGPLAAIIKFKDENEVIDKANASRVGLAGYFYSNDLGQVMRVARKLEVGMIGINDGIVSCCEAPFGGIKESGLGREGSHLGIEEFTNVKYICLGGIKID